MNQIYERLTTNCVYCGGLFDDKGNCPRGCYEKVIPKTERESEFDQLWDDLTAPKVDGKTKCKEIYIDNFIEIFLSLSKSLQNAGGTVKSLEELKKMSAYDLICLLAPNKIRFYNLKE